jgi:peptidoglycan/LPS O-acetylase OafA/YrhL
MESLLSLVLWLAIYGAIFYLLWWVVGLLPAPFQTVGRIIVAVVAVIALINLLLPMAGHPPVIRLR